MNAWRIAMNDWSWLSMVQSSVCGVLMRNPAALKAMRAMRAFMDTAQKRQSRVWRKHEDTFTPTTYPSWRRRSSSQDVRGAAAEQNIVSSQVWTGKTARNGGFLPRSQ